MLRLTDTVKHLVLINVICFLIAQFLLPNFLTQERVILLTRLFSPGSGYFEPYQIVTSVFSHADFRHLLFNMLGLVFIGPAVEQALGGKRFLTLYLLAALISTVPTLIGIYPVVLGASGATTAVLVAFAAMFPNMKLMLIFPPIPIKAKWLVGGVVAYDLLFGLSGATSQVAHLAHIAGGVTALVLIYYWGKFNLR